VKNSRLRGIETSHIRPRLGQCPALARTGNVALNWGTEVLGVVWSRHIHPANAHCAKNNVYGCQATGFGGSDTCTTAESSWALKGFLNEGTTEGTEVAVCGPSVKRLPGTTCGEVVP
jgi:hypothetical protein